MAGEQRNPSIKEELGFREGADVDVFLVDKESDRADRLGYLRPEYGNIPRLFERFELDLSDETGFSIFFGQSESPPFVVKLAPDAEGGRSGRVETELFEATVRLTLLSPYNPGRYVLTVAVERSERGRRGSASRVLPEAWRSQNQQQ